MERSKSVHPLAITPAKHPLPKPNTALPKRNKRLTRGVLKAHRGRARGQKKAQIQHESLAHLPRLGREPPRLGREPPKSGRELPNLPGELGNSLLESPQHRGSYLILPMNWVIRGENHVRFRPLKASVLGRAANSKAACTRGVPPCKG